MLLYILSIVSLRPRPRDHIRSTLNLALLLIFVPSLAQSGWRSAVAGRRLVVALVASTTRSHRKGTRDVAG